MNVYIIPVSLRVILLNLKILMHLLGILEVDYEAFADHDEDCHGPMDTDENRRQFPGNFIWSCCEEDGASEGCLKAPHTVGNKKRRI